MASTGKNKKEDTKISQERVEQFLKGEITLAELQGISVEQAYLFADIGYKLCKQGRYDEASTIFKGLVVLNPNDGYFHGCLASILARQDNLDEALECYDKSYKIDNKNGDVLVGRAEIYLKQGRFNEAMQDLHAVLKCESKEYKDAISRAHALAGATAKIIEDLMKKKASAKK